MRSFIVGCALFCSGAIAIGALLVLILLAVHLRTLKRRAEGRRPFFVASRNGEVPPALLIAAYATGQAKIQPKPNTNSFDTGGRRSQV